MGRPAPEHERGGGTLKVLVLDEEIPWPLDSGKRIRVWNLLTRAAARHRIRFLCYARPDEPGVEALRSKGIEVETVAPLAELRGPALYWRLLLNLVSPYPYSVDKHHTERFRRRLVELLAAEKFDLLHCEWTPYARYLDAARGLPCLVTTHNVESQIWGRRAECSSHAVARLFFAGQARKMAAFERRVLPQVSAVTAVSSPDVEQLREWGISHCTLIENGVDLDHFHPTREPEQCELLFLASLDWFPNQDALDYFLDEMFDAIRGRIPAARLKVVGRQPPAELARRLAAREGVDFVGYADDVRPHLASAAVVVVPLRIGGGSRIKILEALAAGKAVLSTSVGAEGLNTRDGEDIAIADTPADFAERASRLLSDPAERSRLGRNGRKLVESHYGWDAMASRLESVWWQVAGRSCGEPAEAVAGGVAIP